MSGDSTSWGELHRLPSAASRRLAHELSVLAPTPMAVTVVGPSGTGKTGIGRGIHLASPRRGGPVVVQNVGVLPEGLVSAELFGHERGAFTGAHTRRAGRLSSAQGGTIVLDELTKASRAVQHVLLDILDGRPFCPVGVDREVQLDVRVVALTSTPLESAVKSGDLIPDLFERLRTTVVRITPLDSRREDILAIAHFSVDRHHRRFGYTSPPELSCGLCAQLFAASWPGNHRHVDGVIQRTLANARGASVLAPAHLPALDGDTNSVSVRQQFAEDFLGGKATAHAGPSRAARHYGVDRATIRRWVAELSEQRDSPAA